MTFAPGSMRDGDASERAWFVVHPQGLVVRQEGERTSLPTDADAAALGVVASDAMFFGRLDGADALTVECPASEVTPPLAIVGLRGLAASLGAETFAVAGRAMHLVDWSTTSRFCGRCGTKTEPVPHERSMKCPKCALTQYPRIAPAIIVLIRRGDRALLARNGRFPVPFFSTLAGFSEIGESLEETVAREVGEEVGVAVTNIRYFGSQPWPFPHSLMIGFTADWASGEIAVDGEEIAEANWFDATALPLVPPRLSIARRLIDAWVDEIAARATT
jgi:NAD+ diphosphatase